MKTRILLMVVALIVVMAGSGSLVVVADPVVPFKATFVTHPSIVGFDPVTGILTVKIPAEGQATHLGESTFYADMWVDTTTLPNGQTGVMTFTAANGDQLLGSYEGHSTPPPNAEFWGDFEISGGTGRFDGVEGSGAYWGAVEGEEGLLYFDGMLTK